MEGLERCLGGGRVYSSVRARPAVPAVMPRAEAGGSELGEHAIHKPRRPRWTPSEDAKALLETIFSADSFPTFSVRNQLAQQLCIDSRQVQIWFQNRRQRERLKTGSQAAACPSEMDEERQQSPGPPQPVPPHAALLGGGDGRETPSRPSEEDSQATQDAGAFPSPRGPLLCPPPPERRCADRRLRRPQT